VGCDFPTVHFLPCTFPPQAFPFDSTPPAFHFRDLSVPSSLVGVNSSGGWPPQTPPFFAPKLRQLSTNLGHANKNCTFPTLHGLFFFFRGQFPPPFFFRFFPAAFPTLFERLRFLTLVQAFFGFPPPLFSPFADGTRGPPFLDFFWNQQPFCKADFRSKSPNFLVP